jgi:hypothetical protein
MRRKTHPPPTDAPDSPKTKSASALFATAENFFSKSAKKNAKTLANGKKMITFASNIIYIRKNDSICQIINLKSQTFNSLPPETAGAETCVYWHTYIYIVKFRTSGRHYGTIFQVYV